jgi:hypothetical protein
MSNNCAGKVTIRDRGVACTGPADGGIGGKEEEMFYPMTPTSALAYHEGCLKENKHEYLVRSARAARPQFRARFLARVGGALASAGTSLLERYEPALAAGPEVSATAAVQTDF